MFNNLKKKSVYNSLVQKTIQMHRRITSDMIFTSEWKKSRITNPQYYTCIFILDDRYPAWFIFYLNNGG